MQQHATAPLSDSWIWLFPLLEPPETNPVTTRPLIGGVTGEEPTLASTFRHSGWAHNRELVYHALKRTHQGNSRILSFADCGAHAYVYQSLKAPYEYRLGGSGCRDRFCVPCANDRSRVLANNVLAELKDQPARFLTLTLKTNDGPLSTQIDRLYHCFATLRNQPFWRQAVYGGCAFTEIKWSSSAHGWNVHVHCLLHGIYVRKPNLWRAWWAITGDSMIVDIKMVHDHATIGRYITKYVSKPLGNTFLNRPAQLDEMITAMAGRRLCITFGTWRGIKLTQRPTPGEWISIGSFDHVARLAANGHPESLIAITQICRERTSELLRLLPTTRAPPLPSQPDHRQLTFETFPHHPYF